MVKKELLKKESIEDKVSDVMIPVEENEFLLYITKEVDKLRNKIHTYTNYINKIQTYQALGFNLYYYYNETKNKYECEFEKKTKIGFEIG